MRLRGRVEVAVKSFFGRIRLALPRVGEEVEAV